MLESVEVHTEGLMVLPLLGVDPNAPVVITSISGLDPADVTIFTGDYSRDGGYYQGRRSGGRNIVLNLKLNPDYTADLEVSDIREDLYSTFMEPFPDYDQVGLVFYDDRKPARYSIGYVEKFPAEIFSKETTAQISLICPDPWLYSLDDVNEVFPTGWVSTTINYQGSKSQGLWMEFEVRTAVGEMTVDIRGNKLHLVKPSGTWAVGTKINVWTTIGSREITVDGVDSMTLLTPASEWVTLRKGPNVVKTYGNAEGDGKVVLTKYYFDDAWWGV